MTVHTVDLVTAAAVTTEKPGRRHAYAYLPAAEAAADPDTPEAYLLSLGLQNGDQLLAMLRRRPIGDELARWLFSVTRRMTEPTARAQANTVVSLAAALPQANADRLFDIADGLDSFRPGFEDAALAVATHPLATDEVTAKVLCDRAGAYGTGTSLERRIAATGNLVPAALRLARLGGLLDTGTMWHARHEALHAVRGLSQDVGDDATLRQVVATVGVTWSGSRDDLLDTCRAIAAPL